MCQYVSVRVSMCQYVSVSVSTCQYVSARVSTCQYVSVRISMCQYESVRVYMSQYVSVHVSMCHYVSMCQYMSVSQYVSVWVSCQSVTKVIQSSRWLSHLVTQIELNQWLTSNSSFSQKFLKPSNDYERFRTEVFSHVSLFSHLFLSFVLSHYIQKEFRTKVSYVS